MIDKEYGICPEEEMLNQLAAADSEPVRDDREYPVGLRALALAEELMLSEREAMSDREAKWDELITVANGAISS